MKRIVVMRILIFMSTDIYGGNCFVMWSFISMDGEIHSKD